jgi:hypothetical protein
MERRVRTDDRRAPRPDPDFAVYQAERARESAQHLISVRIRSGRFPSLRYFV